MFRLLIAAALCLAHTVVQAQAEDDAPLPRTLELEVAPLRVNCTGVVPMRCLRVRRMPSGTWQIWYAPISGFTYQAGNLYQIRIVGQPRVDPPADADAMEWRLDRVISQRQAWPRRSRSAPEAQ